MNLEAFLWGRRAAHDLAAVETIIGRAETRRDSRTETLDEMVGAARRLPHRLSGRGLCRAPIADFVAKVAPREAAIAPGSTALATAVARYLFKLMAYKDEYEVARLYTDGSFDAEVGKKLQGRHAHLPSGAAAPRQARSGDRRPAQDDLRAVDDERLPRAGVVQVPARHGLRPLRPHR